MAKKDLVTLPEEEREELPVLIHKGKPGARKLTRAHILLLAAQGEGDEGIAEALQTSPSTVQRIRQRFGEERFAATLHDRRRPGKQRRLKGRQEAFWVALACSEPRIGRTRGTMAF